MLLCVSVYDSTKRKCKRAGQVEKEHLIAGATGRVTRARSRQPVPPTAHQNPSARRRFWSLYYYYYTSSCGRSAACVYEYHILCLQQFILIYAARDRNPRVVIIITEYYNTYICSR